MMYRTPLDAQLSRRSAAKTRLTPVLAVPRLWVTHRIHDPLIDKGWGVLSDRKGPGTLIRLLHVLIPTAAFPYTYVALMQDEEKRHHFNFRLEKVDGFVITGTYQVSGVTFARFPSTSPPICF